MAINKTISTDYGHDLDTHHHVSLELNVDRKNDNFVIAFGSYTDATHYNYDYEPISWININIPLSTVPATVTTALNNLKDAIEDAALSTSIFTGGTRVNDDGTPI